uniref:Uncharacterized protein n=1 Tax=Anguilla anguilla TaxID=7936 RepID=A0A0E9XK46_ANGAN
MGLYCTSKVRSPFTLMRPNHGFAEGSEFKYDTNFIFFFWGRKKPKKLNQKAQHKIQNPWLLTSQCLINNSIHVRHGRMPLSRGQTVTC